VAKSINLLQGVRPKIPGEIGMMGGNTGFRRQNSAISETQQDKKNG